MPEQEGEVRAHNFGEVNLGLTYQLAMLEAERCIQCPKPFCVDGCPVRVNIPRFIKFLRDGDLPSAAESLLGDNALPCVTGRVCPQETQCEGVCIRAKKGDSVAIGYLERFVADWAMQNPRRRSRSRSPARPARGSASWAPVPPASPRPASSPARATTSRCSRRSTPRAACSSTASRSSACRRTSSRPRWTGSCAKGVKIEVDAIIGRTYTVPELREEYDALFLAVGAGLPVFMNVPGENFKGVYSANEYLTRVNLMGAWNADSKTPILHGQRVVVVGGGNVAMDSVRTAKPPGRRGGDHRLPPLRRRAPRPQGGGPPRDRRGRGVRAT